MNNAYEFTKVPGPHSAGWIHSRGQHTMAVSILRQEYELSKQDLFHAFCGFQPRSSGHRNRTEEENSTCGREKWHRRCRRAVNRHRSDSCRCLDRRTILSDVPLSDQTTCFQRSGPPGKPSHDTDSLLLFFLSSGKPVVRIIAFRKRKERKSEVAKLWLKEYFMEKRI
ncbi:hypothetical protein AVEN_56482-1 [Araneus ventricosus]|uniref:Uncharacterized protein n=1 Tax=Araneus ventricosus TaxID=182803 RepID=A0A4Y2QJS1_ARAVE|nr:hypothetical protein AVEN_56482-1 [Araneus ventricosus]